MYFKIFLLKIPDFQLHKFHKMNMDPQQQIFKNAIIIIDNNKKLVFFFWEEEGARPSPGPEFVFIRAWTGLTTVSCKN